ncbi:MAG: DsbA family oxidoreductase [Pseudomonadota bacterium]
MIPLDIISDPICPWCYIGKVKLDRALETRPDIALDIHWRPFQLNPNMPAEGMDRRAYLEAKFGGPEGARRVYGQIADRARDAGLEIDFEAIPRTPNTINAHRLIRWARVEGKQTEIVTKLFQRYFERQEDISDPSVLTDAAVTAGLEGPVVAKLLSGEADIAETRAEDAEARQMGVTGVPTFILGRRYALPGAQETELWLRAFDEIAAVES